jgi:hypothetical protein
VHNETLSVVAMRIRETLDGQKRPEIRPHSGGRTQEGGSVKGVLLQKQGMGLVRNLFRMDFTFVAAQLKQRVENDVNVRQFGLCHAQSISQMGSEIVGTCFLTSD